MRIWKRLLLVGTILCLAMMLLFPSIAAADEITVSIDAPAEVGEGADFIARVNITDVTNFNACNYDVIYDPTILEVTDVTDGIIGETVIPVDMWGFIPPETQGEIRVIENIPGLSAVSGSGYLAEIHFHLVGSGGNTSDITLSNGILSDNTASEIPATLVGDTVHVAGAPRPGGSGGGGGPAPTPKLKLEMMSKVFSVPTTNEGVLEEALEATSPDGAVTLRFSEGTQALDSEGDRLDRITVDTVSVPPEPPEKAHVVVAYDFGPQGVTFDPEIELIMHYDAEGLPEGVSEESLLIACYETQSEECAFLSTVADTEAHTVSVWISHFTVFAIVGIEEAAFHFANLSISPITVGRGESVTISAEVTNIGGLEGSCMVKLMIDGLEETAQELSVAPGATSTVTFTVTRGASGAYSVEINGLGGEFTVTASPPPWIMLAGTLGGIATAATIVALLIWGRRRAA